MSIFEFKDDFEKPIFQLEGTNLLIRPDGLVPDKLVSYSLGPVALSDTTNGIIFKIWRLRAEIDLDDNQTIFYISDFTSEQVLHTTSQTDIREISLAFDQAGFPAFTVQIGDNELWLFWFDPLENPPDGDFVFVNLGSGRTPRIGIDQPLNIPDSDLHIVYIVDDEIKHRIQGERYEDVHSTGVDVDENHFIELVYSSASRFHVVYSIRDPLTGRYSYKSLSSLVFDTFLFEAFEVFNEVISASMLTLVLAFSIETEAFEVFNEIVDAMSQEPIISREIIEAFEVFNEILNSNSVIALLIETIETEAFEVFNELISCVSTEIVVHENLSPDAFEVFNQIISATSTV